MLMSVCLSKFSDVQLLHLKDVCVIRPPHMLFQTFIDDEISIDVVIIGTCKLTCVPYPASPLW